MGVASRGLLFLCLSLTVADPVASTNHIISNSGGNSYLFPTDASHKINSGFADYRSSHFHAGIDISTNRKIGYPVYAARAGYVYRISVSPFGYGKMIVLRHDDSTFTVYGHLSEFSSDIEKKVDAKQSEAGKYGVNIYLSSSEIKVERGEIIARTGATGVGGPHLHFEIRGKDFSPIDPLIYSSLDVSGFRTPKIFGVAVRGFNSDVARVARVVRSGKEYRSRGEFRMREPFYFIVHAADSYGHGAYKRPPKFIQLKVDDLQVLSLDLTRVDVDDDLDISSLVDLSLSRRSKTYYKLCVDRAIPFSVFTPGSPGSGLIGGNFRNGKHTYEISIEDEDGNRASVAGTFFLDIPSSAGKNANAGGNFMQSLQPFDERTISPSTSLTLNFPTNCFDRDVDVSVDQHSPTSFSILPANRQLRRRIDVVWKVDDRDVTLFRRVRNHWTPVFSKNDGKVLTAEIAYKTGEFSLQKDKTPPTVGKIRFARKNPFYISVAPNDLSRVFVYFKVSDSMSGVDTDHILLKVGDRTYLCEYDVDKHSAFCSVSRERLLAAKKVELSVHDNAGNERRIVSRTRAGSFGKRV